MLTNGRTESTMHSWGVFGLSHRSERLDETEVWPFAWRRSILWPLNFLLGREKNTWTPWRFGRSSSISWYNNVRHGTLLLQSFIWLTIKAEACVWGTSLQWRAENPNTTATQRKRWGFSFDPDEYSWDTLKACRYCPADSNNSVLSRKRKMHQSGSLWVHIIKKKKQDYFQQHLMDRLIKYGTHNVITFPVCTVAYIIMLL